MADKKTIERQIQELQAQLAAKERMCLELSEKLAQAKAHEERQLSPLTSTGPDCFFDLSLDLLAIASTHSGYFKRVNPAFSRILGWSEKELLARPFLDFVHPDDLAISQGAQKKLATGRDLTGFANRVRCKDGTYRLISWNSASLPASGLTYCVGRDMTEASETQQSLARHRELLQAIFDNIPILLVLWDPQLHTFSLNRHSVATLGWTAADANEGDFMHKVYPDPEQRGHVIDYMRSLASGWHEWVCTTRDGERVPIDWANIHLSDEVMIGIGVDLRERRQAEEALRESEQRYRMLFENMSEGFFLAEIIRNETGMPVDYRYLAANRAMDEIVGMHHTDYLGKTRSETMPAPSTWLEAFGRVARTGQPEELEGYSAGLNRYFRVSAYSPRTGQFACLVRDITERRQFEDQLRALNDELERRVELRTCELQETQAQYLHAEKLSAIGKLSASIAHEFNNPLQAITTILTGLKKTATLPEEETQFLELAVGEAARMKKLIRSLQGFYRPSSDTKTPMDLHEAIDSLMLLCKNDFKRKKISVVLHYAENLPSIFAVPDQIKQVLINLLNNAADACHEKDGQIIIRTFVENGRVGLAIGDNGTGIDPGQMERIFQPFFTTKSEVKGTGLGLSICHGIVQYHSGEIRVESEPGEGSIFTVLLPVGADKEDRE